MRYCPDIESPEEFATRVYMDWPRVVNEYQNGTGPRPEQFLRAVLDGLPASVACLVGFRLAQAMRSTPGGNREASVVHALIGVFANERKGGIPQ